MTTEICTNAFGDRYLKAIDGDIFATASADEVLARNVSSELFRPDCFHILVGTDSGLLIDYIKRSGIPVGATYLAIEPEPVLASVVELSPALANDGSLLMSSPDNWLATANHLNLETYILKKEVLVHPCLASKAAGKALYLPLIDRTVLELDEAAFKVREPYSEAHRIPFYLANLSENITPIHQLYDKFKGQTAIVLGAGPSLDLHLDWIREHRNQLFIIAASRLCRQLYLAQLYPDMVVSVDWQEINYEQSKWLYRLPPETILAHSSFVSPQLLAQWPGQSFFMGNRYPWDTPLNADYYLHPSGPTVSNSGISLAGKMGFLTVLLSGVDLCTPAGSSTHAGSLYLDKNNSYTYKVKTYSGIPAYTNIHMFHAAQILEQQVKKLGDTRIINLSSYAFEIRGISHKTCDEVILTGSLHADRAQHLVPIRQKNNLAHNKQVLEELQRVHSDLKKFLELVSLAKKHNQKMHKRDKTGNFNPNAKKKLDNVKKRLDTEFEYLMRPIREIANQDFIAAMTTRDVYQFSDKELEKLGLTYYSAFESGATQMKTLVESGIARVQSRLLEDSPAPELTQLAQQWRKDRQTGRNRVWRARHPNLAVVAPNTILLNALEQEFISSDHTSGSFLPTPDIAWYIREHIETAYINADFAILEHIDINYAATAFSRDNSYHLNTERLQQLTSLTGFYLEFSRNNTKNALYYFCSIAKVDYTETLLQAAANAAISQQDVRCIEQVLTALIKFNHQYLSQYGDWLREQSQWIEAINTYTRYLQHYPENVAVWLNLASLYREIGEQNLATVAYEFVLQLDPTHKTALAFINA